MPRRKFALALALLSSQTVWADLTIRYQFEVKFGPGFPAAAAEEARRRIETALPNKIAMQIKGDKCANSAGPLSAIVDAGKDEITLFSPAIKQFATAPRPEYERWLARQQVLAAGQQA